MLAVPRVHLGETWDMQDQCGASGWWQKGALWLCWCIWLPPCLPSPCISQHCPGSGQGGGTSWPMHLLMAGSF